MSFSRLFIIIVILLFVVIGVTALVKKSRRNTTPVKKESVSSPGSKIKIELDKKPATPKNSPPKQETPLKEKKTELVKASAKNIPHVDRVHELFDVPSTSSIVETITYKRSVPWLAGKSAWIADYATHYGTSRHFIARSLNRGPDYTTQNVADGDTFNVYRRDKEIKFYLVIDQSTCKMLLYYIDDKAKESVHLKTYDVGLGRLDSASKSGTLTPIGKYTLGSKVVIYKPGSMGLFHNKSTEMIRVFGTRWIPFDKALDGASAEAKGYGIHGSPWVEGREGQLVENVDCISKYESDGCIRLSTKDMEELFAIVITKPTTVEIVRNINEASLPVTQ